MESLPKDVTREILLNLSPPDIINFCLTSKDKNKIVCNSNEFWLKKLEKDYPGELLEYYRNGISITNGKDRYIKRFTHISKTLEGLVSVFKHGIYGNSVSKYLTKEFDINLYKSLYRIYNTIFTLYTTEQLINIDKDDNREIEDDTYNGTFEELKDFIPNSTTHEDRYLEELNRKIINLVIEEQLHKERIFQFLDLKREQNKQ